MSDFPTFDDLFRAGRDEALIRQGKLTREVIEREGTDANILNALSATAAEQVIDQLVDVEAGLFLDSAEGQALDRIVFDRYGLVRKSASPALGSVAFSVSTPTVAAFIIPSGTLLASTDGIQYITTQQVQFPINTLGPVLVPIRSVLAGKAQQAAVGTIISIINSISGAPNSLVVTNTVATSGADDDESDDSLRARARAFFTTARRGTIAAIEAGALAVQGVRTATAFEVIDALGRPARFVLLVVSDPYTDALAKLAVIPPTYDAQSKQLALAVFNGLSDVRPAGIFVQVEVAQVVLQPIQLVLTFQAGADADATAEEARSIVVSYVNSLSPGAPFIRQNAVNALRTIGGLFITGNEVASPPGNVTTRPLQVLRTSLSLVVAISSQTGTPLALTSNPDAFTEV
jgi:hypothetical protein